MCILGRRLLKDINVMSDCNKNLTGVLHQIYCGNSTKCDAYYEENNLTIINGIRGLASGVFLGELTVMHLFPSCIPEKKQRDSGCDPLTFRKHLGQFPRGRRTDCLWI